MRYFFESKVEKKEKGYTIQIPFRSEEHTSELQSPA